VVHDPTVDLLGHALIEAAVSRLHVKHGDLPPFRRDGGQATVRVAQDQHGIGLNLAQHRIGARDDLADRLRRRLPGRFQKWSGLRSSRSSKKI
jgi:hypothetical protein